MCRRPPDGIDCRLWLILLRNPDTRGRLELTPAVILKLYLDVLNGKNVAVVLSAYNAEKALRATVAEIPSCVDTPILVDDGSSDNTVNLPH